MKTSLAHREPAREPALILQHPSAPVNYDNHDPRDPIVVDKYPPVTPESIARAKEAAAKERADAAAAVTDAQWRVLDAHEAIDQMVREFGAARVYRILRTVAAMHGQDVTS